MAGPPRRRRGGGRRRRRRSEYKGPGKGADGEDKAVEVEGTISAVLAGTMFKVKLASDHELLAHISGKMRKRFIRLVVGDKVKMEMSPYDTSKARIVYRIG
ncbi:MAG: translation initiation factor IF-1 [Verrucomicrobiota bacterium]|nr:translation initiation factor IF-1 [Verrucomicrobiota bacterium]